MRNSKHVEFDVARKISGSRNLGEPLCFHCNKPGHHVKFCPYLNVGKTPPVKRKSNLISQSENPFSSDSENDELIYQEVFIKDKSISALIDCGSEVSLIESSKAKMLSLDLKPYTGRVIKAVNGLPVLIEGQTDAQVILKSSEGNKIVTVKLAAVKNFDFSLLLGNDFNKSAEILIDCKNKSILFNKNNKTEPFGAENSVRV
jgi:hypothetical protein